MSEQAGISDDVLHGLPSDPKAWIGTLVSGPTEISDDISQTGLFNECNSSNNEDHGETESATRWADAQIVDPEAEDSSEKADSVVATTELRDQVMQRNATPSHDHDDLLNQNVQRCSSVPRIPKSDGSGRAGFSDDFHQRVLFNLFNSSLNEDHALDNPASSQHGGGIKLKRNATPSGDNNYLLESRKRRSKVWNDFRLDIKSDGKKKAICDHCNKEFVGESKKGTSHLLNHLKICPEKRRKKEDGNKPSENGNLTSLVVVGKKSTADLELSSLDLTRSAIKRGGKTFMDDLLHGYRDEKRKLCESFTKLPCRFSLAVDEVNYCCSFTVYYIDENWEMKRNIWFLQDQRVRDFEKLLRASILGLNLDESLFCIVWPNSCICLMVDIYNKLLRSESSDSKSHFYTKKIASRVRDNFVEGYWKGNSLVLSIAAVLDPYFKMDLVRD